jgi:Arc/MetJ-type ribon-helix-helix transcriptional regulator
MPKARKRYDASGQPLPCTVTLPPSLAVFIYRERKKRRFKDETELVAAIVREWANAQDSVQWDDLLAELKTEADADERAEGKAKKKPKGG